MTLEEAQQKNKGAILHALTINIDSDDLEVLIYKLTKDTWEAGYEAGHSKGFRDGMED